MKSLFSGAQGPSKKRKGLFDDLDVNQVFRDIKTVSYYIPCENGKKFESQETMVVAEHINNSQSHFFAIIDGHGSSGKEASSACNDFLTKYVNVHGAEIANYRTKSEREGFLKNLMESAEKMLKNSGIDYSSSGTCFISMLLQRASCSVALIGDSRAVLCRHTPREKAAIELTHDHRVTREEERERILGSGGKIEKFIFQGSLFGPYRVWLDEEGPGYCLTRTLGDFRAKKIGLISTPEIEHIYLQPGDKFIIIASDGLWDMIGSCEAVSMVHSCAETENAAEFLCKTAAKRWETSMGTTKRTLNRISDNPLIRVGTDDISCIVIYFDVTMDLGPYGIIEPDPICLFENSLKESGQADQVLDQKGKTKTKKTKKTKPKTGMNKNSK